MSCSGQFGICNYYWEDCKIHGAIVIVYMLVLTLVVVAITVVDSSFICT